MVLNKFISSEALVRWDNPKRGLLSPSQFVPQAEQMGMIHKIDMYIFERVCKDLQDCKKKEEDYFQFLSIFHYMNSIIMDLSMIL